MKDVTPLPTGAAKARAVRAMFDRIARRYDVVNRVMTLGMDVGWRRRAIAELRLPRRSVVLDLACGTGDFCRMLEGKWHIPIGVDFAYEMLRNADTRAQLVQADILELPVRSGSVDGAVCGFALRNVVELHDLFAEIARAVRPGGRIALLEVSRPRGVLMRKGHDFYCNNVVPVIGGLLSDRHAYRYLPRSFAYLPEPDELLSMVRAAGFEAVDRIELAGGIAQLITGTRSGKAA